ncbi:MAG TPA: hypothetical protein VM260_21035, partial [Pirellula sp.]|nr:hypothetical protein [Pirellula sp.]
PSILAEVSPTKLLHRPLTLKNCESMLLLCLASNTVAEAKNGSIGIGTRQSGNRCYVGVNVAVVASKPLQNRKRNISGHKQVFQ